MITHRRKKIEIVVERARAPAILRHIEGLGATGYTVISDVAGKGRHGERGADEVLDVNRSVMLVVVTSEAVAAKILDATDTLLRNTTGVIWMSDVEVLRGDHF